MSRRKLERRARVWWRYIDRCIKIVGDHGRVTAGMHRNQQRMFAAHAKRRAEQLRRGDYLCGNQGCTDCQGDWELAKQDWLGAAKTQGVPVEYALG